MAKMIVAGGSTTSDAFGAGGLGLSGVGEGGGGAGEGIGLGSVGAIGHGAGTGTGQGQGIGSGRGRLGGAHSVSAPRIRQGATQVNGRLPPEVIQRIVRQNFGRFRLCYESGLRSNPNLQGRVAARFVIDRTGNVATVQDGGSDLPDANVIGCVIRSFGNLQFPEPEGGMVTVVYPVIFSPGEDVDPRQYMNPRGAPPPPPVREIARPAEADPYTGKLKDIMGLLAKKDLKGARGMAQAWHDDDPGDILGLVGPVACLLRSLRDGDGSAPDLHRYAEHLVALLDEEGGGDGRIDSSREADGYLALGVHRLGI